ncbi:MerR family transcriptional regulator [Mycobacterium crocinum]|uniref:MerR family transcriptional regulator n=1 Tax=Mycolicibacterium crocinum TaxID=388459 RepID=A0ABY3TRG4_9MYCO|nr:MerR family transcriptional regulator [Mycolicibacterium crocinum]MCV7213811.1 MerR family transcriptional regulator [Mycolicibacterium crocinum]ULN43996.1 MerR family transcriptional regulator [Mycolicibacterium crocinum]
MPTTPLTRDLTIQEVSRQSGLTESALRYYERIGLIDPVPRDESSGHRRYPPELVEAIESLSCLRSTGMSVHDMRTYVDNMRRGTAAAADQRQLFDDHARRLADDIARLQVRQQYVAAKAQLWAARERGDTAAEDALVPGIIALGAELMSEEEKTGA